MRRKVGYALKLYSGKFARKTRRKMVFYSAKLSHSLTLQRGLLCIMPALEELIKLLDIQHTRLDFI